MTDPSPALSTPREQIASMISGKGPTIASLRTADDILALILPPDYKGRAQGIIDQMAKAEADLADAVGIPTEARAVINLYMLTIRRLCYQLGAVQELWPDALRLPREDWLATHAEPILDVLGVARWGISQLNADNAGRQNRDYARCDAIEEIVRLFVGKVRREKVERASVFISGYLYGEAWGSRTGGRPALDFTEAYKSFRCGDQPADPEAFGRAIAQLVEGLGA